MSEYTPGPWTVKYMIGGTCGPHWTLKAGSEYVGHFYDEDGLCPNGEANVRLIAAAPDLLAACEAALQDMESLVEPYLNPVIVALLLGAINRTLAPSEQPN